MAKGSQNGKSNNPNGREKGSKNVKTKQWELLGEFITDSGAKKFVEEVNKLEGVDYINAYSKVLSYFKPQLARTEIKADIGIDKKDISGVFPKE